MFIIVSVQLDIILNDFEKLIEFYYDHFSSALYKLNYSDGVPTLENILNELKKCSFFGSMLMVEAVSMFSIDHEKDGINLEKIDACDDDGDECRKKVMNNPRYVEIIKQLIPFFAEREMLDLR